MDPANRQEADEGNTSDGQGNGNDRALIRPTIPGYSEIAGNSSQSQLTVHNAFSTGSAPIGQGGRNGRNGHTPIRPVGSPRHRITENLLPSQSMYQNAFREDGTVVRDFAYLLNANGDPAGHGLADQNSSNSLGPGAQRAMALRNSSPFNPRRRATRPRTWGHPRHLFPAGLADLAVLDAAASLHSGYTYTESTQFPVSQSPWFPASLEFTDSQNGTDTGPGPLVDSATQPSENMRGGRADAPPEDPFELEGSYQHLLLNVGSLMGDSIPDTDDGQAGELLPSSRYVPDGPEPQGPENRNQVRIFDGDEPEDRQFGTLQSPRRSEPSGLDSIGQGGTSGFVMGETLMQDREMIDSGAPVDNGGNHEGRGLMDGVDDVGSSSFANWSSGTIAPPQPSHATATPAPLNLTPSEPTYPAALLARLSAHGISGRKRMRDSPVIDAEWSPHYQQAPTLRSFPPLSPAAACLPVPSFVNAGQSDVDPMDTDPSDAGPMDEDPSDADPMDESKDSDSMEREQ